jgi:hypothetical protein
MSTADVRARPTANMLNGPLFDIRGRTWSETAGGRR